MVPFASLAVLQREGQLDYALSSGRTRSGSSDDKEYNFIQSSLAYGATSNFTLYTGFQQAEDKYTNLLLGAGFNLGTIGALSFDGSQSWADVKTSERTGAIVSRPLQQKLSADGHQLFRGRLSLLHRGILFVSGFCR